MVTNPQVTAGKILLLYIGEGSDCTTIASDAACMYVVYRHLRSENAGPTDLDAKRFFPEFSKLADKRLTLAELEAATCLGTSRLFTFYLAAIAGNESFCTQCLLVVSIDFDEGACDGETQSLALASEATTLKVHLDVVLLSHVEKGEGLLYYELEDRRGEVFGKVTLVDGNLTSTFGNEDAGNGALATA